MKDSDMRNEKLAQFEDAAIALFMEEYSDLLAENIEKEMAEAEAVEFPEELDRRCRALMEQEGRKMRIKRLRRSAKKVLSRVAMVTVAILALSSVPFMTVEAFRLPVMNFFIEKRLGFSELSGSNGVQASNQIPSDFDVSDPLGGLLPEEYRLVSITGDEYSNLFALYENKAESFVCIHLKKVENQFQIDVEDAEVSEVYEIHGQKATLSQEGKEIRLVWLIEEPNLMGALSATGFNSEELMVLAEQVTYLLGK